MTEITRILLADDHSVVREGLKRLIESQPHMTVIGEAADGRAALQAAIDLRPDLLILDIAMPLLNGIEVTERLKTANPAIRVLALSAYEDSGYLQALLHAGAGGYLLKRTAAEGLVQAIRTVATGGIYLDADLAASLTAPPAAQAPPADPDELSQREREVVQLVAQGYANKEIAIQFGLSVKTIETYKARAMQKLGLENRVDLVRYALQAGWLSGFS